jgi:lipoprotein-releasing system permease protein
LNITSSIAFRYLISGHKNSFFGFITALSVLGIAIAIAAMIVVLSVINGFESEMRERFLAANAHVLLYKFPSGLEKPDRWIGSIEQNFSKDITGASPFVHMETMAKNHNLLNSVLVRGIHPSKREKVQPLKKLVRPASALDLLDKEMTSNKNPEVASVILGTGLAKLMNVKLGETVGLLSPLAEDPLSAVTNFKIIGIYDSGLSHYDNKLAILSIPAAQKLFKMNNIVTGVEIGMKDPWESPSLSNKLSEQYKNVSVRQWQEYNKTMFEALKFERGLISLLVALVAVVGGFNILTTLFVSVVQKGKDIAILKSLGTQNKQIVRVFIKQGLIMGLAGSVLGAGIAYGASLLLENYEFIKLPEIYMLAKLPVEFDPTVYFVTCVFGVIISTLAGVIPARNAAKVPPGEGFKGSAT